MLIGIGILFLCQIGIGSAWTCNNNNGNFTVNESTGYISSIKDKNSNFEYIIPKRNVGLAYYSNGTYYDNYNSPKTTFMGIPPNINSSLMNIYYKLNNESLYNENDTYVYDFSGNGNNGTANNTQFQSKTGILADGSIYFNGVNSSINFKNIEIYNSSTNNQNFTISMWIYPENLNGTSTGWIFKTIHSGDGLRCRINTNNNSECYAEYNGGGSPAGLVSTNKFNGKAWNFLVYSYDSNNWSVTLNGVKTTASYGGSFKNTSVNAIGNGYLSGNYFHGKMDEFIIYNRALSDSLINEIYINYTAAIINYRNVLNISFIQRHPFYNISYIYRCNNNSFDIFNNIVKTDDNPVISNNKSDFTVRYDFALNNSLLIENNFNVSPYGNNYLTYGSYNYMYNTLGGYLMGVNVYSPNNLYVWNNNLSLLIQPKNPRVMRVAGMGYNQVQNWAIQSSTLQSSIYQIDNPFFNSTYNNLDLSFSIVLNNNYAQSQINAYDSNPNRNSSYDGLWVSECSDLTTVSDAKLLGYVNGGVKWLHLNCWYPYYGNYTSGDGNWITEAGELMNKTYLNSLINRMNNLGLKVFLYVNPIELQYGNATANYPNDIVINITGGYQRGNWEESNSAAQTYLMNLDNTNYKHDFVKDIRNAITNYPSISGIYIDRADYVTADYGHKAHFVGNNNLTYDTVYNGLFDTIVNISNYAHSQNKLVIINVPRTTDFIPYADFFGADGTASMLSTVKLNSGGKYVYTVNIGLPNDESLLNISLLWGNYYYYYGQYLPKINYLISKIANQQLISWHNDSLLTMYPNYYGINKNSLLTSLSNSDWYDMLSHLKVGSQVSSYNYIQTQPTANLIMYNFTFGIYQLTEGNSYTYAYDNANNIIDPYVPISFAQSTLTEKHIASNLSDDVVVDVIISADCSKVGKITYTSDSGASSITYNHGDYVCANNKIILSNLLIEPAQNSNVIRLYYNQGLQEVCNDSALTFSQSVSLIGIILTMVLIAGVISLIVLSFKGVIDISSLSGKFNMEGILWGVLITLVTGLVLATVTFIVNGSVCPAYGA
jgi:hypothetical protein